MEVAIIIAVCLVLFVLAVNLYDKKKPAFFVTEYHPELEADYPDGISKPVQEIVKTFQEKGRWKIVNFETDPWANFRYKSTYVEFKDSKTGEIFNVFGDTKYFLVERQTWKLFTYPTKASGFGLPTWLNEKEQAFVLEHLNKALYVLGQRIKRYEDRKRRESEAQAEVNKIKARQRLIGVYCK